MQVVKIENHTIPKLPLVSTTTLQKIPFANYINPFVNLLILVNTSISSWSFAMIDYSVRAAWVARLIIFRLLHKPLFDPLNPSFKTEFLANVERQVPLLLTRINQLDQKFKHDHLIVRDMKEFHSLIYEIEETKKLLRSYLNILERRTYHLAVQDDIERIEALYIDLDDQINLFCKKESKHLCDQFSNVLRVFVGCGLNLRGSIGQELIQTWKRLKESLKDRLGKWDSTDPSAAQLKSKFADLSEQMQVLEAGVADHSPVGLSHPLKLSNIGNSCYFDSVLQLLACIDLVCEELNKPITRDGNDTEYLKRLAIQQELLQFLKVQKINGGNDCSQMEFILFLLGGPSLHRLREEIFKSGLHPSLDPREIYQQHDAADVLLLLTDHFLPICRFKIQEIKSAKAFEGLEFPKRDVDIEPLLKLPMVSGKRDLKGLMKAYMNKEVVKDKLDLDPKSANVFVIDPEKAAEAVKKPPESVDEFLLWRRFKELPSVLTIELVRHTFDNKTMRAGKNSDPITLPQNGIVDLTEFYDAPAGAPKNAKYKIKSFVVHHGSSLNGGHYVTYVEMNGKYYLCDDCDSKGYREISKKVYFSQKDAYLLVFERLAEES